jgi:hypothetical protein
MAKTLKREVNKNGKSDTKKQLLFLEPLLRLEETKEDLVERLIAATAQLVR